MTTLLGSAYVRIRPDASNFASDADRALTPAFKKLAGVATGILAGAAAAAFAKSTLDIGRTYQDTLNNLKAVASASDAQMTAVSKTAKALGSDLTLTQPGTTLVRNKSGRPEAVFTADKFEVFRQIAANGTAAPLVGTINLQPTPGETAQQQMESVTHELRRLRRGGR